LKTALFANSPDKTGLSSSFESTVALIFTPASNLLPISQIIVISYRQVHP